MKISLLTVNSFFALEAVAQKFSIGKSRLKSFANLTGKHLCQSLICNKERDSDNFANFAKLLNVPFLQKTSGPLLLRLCFKVGLQFSVQSLQEQKEISKQTTMK